MLIKWPRISKYKSSSLYFFILFLRNTDGLEGLIDCKAIVPAESKLQYSSATLQPTISEQTVIEFNIYILSRAQPSWWIGKDTSLDKPPYAGGSKTNRVSGSMDEPQRTDGLEGCRLWETMSTTSGQTVSV